jgi:inositol-phosphate phosphatase / L-galactose 1-phosphate phosphatase / histidinol-phosphatase
MSGWICPPEFPAIAHRLADASGEVIRRAFRQSFAVEGKEDLSPVTKADREAERVLRAMIEAEYPAHGIIGEEFGKTNAEAEFVWVLDPVDGTRAFACGKPVFGTLIALLHKDVLSLGVIDQPILRERWIGASGHQTLFNGKPCKTRSCASPGEAVAIISPNLLLEDPHIDLEPFRRMAKACKTYGNGCDCYGYGLLASGHCDLVVENDLKLHDFAALAPVIEGAGGIVTDWQGRALGLSSDGTIMAAGDRRAGRAALELLRTSS